MKVLVTVGTTRFDSLNNAVLSIKSKNIEWTLQTAEPLRTPSYMRSKTFFDDIEKEYYRADVVVTHAGAGSVYKLLEMGKRTVVVPNLQREDKHQEELAAFVEMNNYATVLWDITNLEQAISKARHATYEKYEVVSFFKGKEIAETINHHVHKN